MKKNLLFALPLVALSATQAMAQTRIVSGRVIDRISGESLPGVTVLLKASSNGISTNSDGSYTLTIPEAGGTLVFSSLGYITIERPIGNDSQVDVSLATDSKQLSEVVVTSLGLERDTRSLGYTTQEIKADQLAQKSEPNLLSALQGKVAGVTISNASGLPGSSTNINIRGISSLQGDNQPLFVLDGIPISNDLDRTGNSLEASQTSNRVLDIDPELVASVNVLKGPAAAALYGSRASNGAIIITTKSGASVNRKLEATVTSGFALQQVYGLADLQNEYGQGLFGNTLVDGKTGDIYSGASYSWGPRFGATPTRANGLLLADGSLLPYQPYENNIRDFFRTGRILTNGINLRGGSPIQNFTLSVNNTDQKGITNNSSLKRLNGQIAGNTTLLNKIKVGGSLLFTQSDQAGPLVGNRASAFGELYNIPRSFDLQGLPSQNAAGESVFFSGVDNPYWSLANNTNTSDLTRFISSANIGYDFTPWLNVSYRAGLDTYTDRRKQVIALTSAAKNTGLVLDDIFYRNQFTGDLIATLKKDNILENVNATLLLGNQVNSQRFQNVTSQADNLLIPNFPNSQAGSVFSNGTGERTSLKRLIGYYAQLSLSYQNYLFLELAGRTDISSTLLKSNNTYFYPAANFAFVFSDAFDLSSDVFSYGKIKGSAAQVGRSAEPYSLYTTYSSAGFGNNLASFNFPFNGRGGFTLSDTRGLPTLKPEFIFSLDAGVNVGFFNNRLTLDATYFQTRTKNLIIPISTPATTGYTSRIANAGRVENKGLEVLLTLSPVRTDNFKWDITSNYTRIRNKVVELADGLTQSTINGDYFNGTEPSYRVGEPYGIIVGNAYAKAPNGQYLINPASGTFLRTEANQILANPNFDWQAGLTNNFSYKGAFLSLLVDTNQGGQVISSTNGLYRDAGALKETGVDREVPRVIPGVIENGDGTYRPNNIQIPAQVYWQSMGSQSDLNVYDATVYRLREATLGYMLPNSLLERMPFGAVSISLSGRNLFYYAPNANFDPALNTQGAGNIRGLDLQGPPNARTYGVNIRFSL